MKRLKRVTPVMRSGHVLERRQVVPGTLEEVFAFFESPWNLERITPPWLRFEITDATDEKMRVGTEIAYGLRWQGVPLRWRTRIAECEPNVMFADEMTSGPYRRWYHRHLFEPVAGGVEVRDVVEYELPLGWIGGLAHALLVRRQLEAIFDYRSGAVAARFPGGSPR
jgi:ligand-binding SRPBCC domain-containing protein